MTIDDVRLFIAGHRWTFARTIPEHPHWYVVRQRCTDEDAFVAMVEFIRAQGQPRTFGKRMFIYLDVDDFIYWTMGSTISETTIINRAKINPAAPSSADLP